MSSKTKIVLFNYGGGMRGLIPAYIMSYIEDHTGLRMADMVDVFAGPSTGAILNSALNVPHPDDPKMPKYRARHMVKFYEREGEHIFPIDSFRDFRALIHDFNNRTMKISQLHALFRHGHYDPKHLGHCLRLLYGETQLNQALKSLIVPVFNIDGDTLKPAAESDETEEDTPVRTKNNFIDEGGHAVWLKHIRPSLNHHNVTPDVSMFDAVMGSTAAPTYFPCHHFQADFHDGGGQRNITAIDGSIFDNPCISYHGAIKRHIHDDSRTIMILLGTGFTLKSISKDQWNSYGNLGVVDPVNDLPLINILFHAGESALLESFYEALGDDLYMFNKSLITCVTDIKPSVQIDDASLDNLEALKNFAQAIIEEQKDELDQLCELLVTNYEDTQKEKLISARESGSIFSFFKNLD